MRFIRILLVVLLIFPAGLFCRSGETQVKRIELEAPSLKNNLLNDPLLQTIYVCLPGDYNNSDKNYPVVYYLPGFGLTAENMIEGSYYDVKMGEIYDSLCCNNIINDLILVIANGRNFYAGSFYVNSTVTGNWEDFIVHDLVNYIDGNFRTIKDPSARGISGHSMGGFGALNIAMRFPDVFGSVYSMSPAIYGENGMDEHGMFSDTTWVKEFVTRNNTFAEMDNKAAFDSLANYLRANPVFNLYFEHAIGAAFSPDTLKVPYVNYPYKLVNNKLVVDSTIIATYRNAMGNMKEKVEEYEEKLTRLNTIAVECGRQDEFSWIISGSKYFSQLLDKADIDHEFLMFEGTHGNMIKERIADYMLPFFFRSFK